MYGRVRGDKEPKPCDPTKVRGRDDGVEIPSLFPGSVDQQTSCIVLRVKLLKSPLEKHKQRRRLRRSQVIAQHVGPSAPSCLLLAEFEPFYIGELWLPPLSAAVVSKVLAMILVCVQ